MRNTKDFNEFRFAGLNFKERSNKYYTMDRMSVDGGKIVVKVASSQIFETKYGYALILDRTHVVFLKNWQVSDNYFGIEVLLTKEYFTPKEWGEFEDFGNDEDNLKWSTWVDTAKAQDGINEDGVKLNPVAWQIKD